MTNPLTGVDEKRLFLIALICFTPLMAFANQLTCAQLFANEPTIQLPGIKIDENSSPMEKALLRSLKEKTFSFARTIFRNLSGLEKSHKKILGGVVIAPFGGSKIRAFTEIDAQTLVIVDWTPTGDFTRIKFDFEEATALKEAALNGLLGGMDTREVKSTSPISQILLKLKFELGVSKTKVTRYQAEDVPIIRIEFKWKGRQRQVVFVETQINSDTSGKSPLPLALKSLVSQGAQWIYLSADGIGIFNAKVGGNGLIDASKQLLQMIDPDGRVILDYPHRPNTQEFNGMTFMGPRAYLEEWGLKRLMAIVVPQGQPLFGYSGPNRGDEVRVYQKSSEPSKGPLKTELDFSGSKIVEGPVFFQIK